MPTPLKPEPKPNKRNIYHYIAAALLLPTGLYGLVTGNNRFQRILIVGFLVMLWAIRQQKK